MPSEDNVIHFHWLGLNNHHRLLWEARRHIFLVIRASQELLSECHLFHLQLINLHMCLLGLAPHPSPQLLLGLWSTQI